MPNSRFGYSVKKNSFKGLNIDCVQYSNIIRITYYSYSYSGTILNPNIIRIRIRPNICARILFVFVFAHSEKTNIIRIRIRSKFWFRIIFVFVFGPKNSIRSPLLSTSSTDVSNFQPLLQTSRAFGEHWSDGDRLAKVLFSWPAKGTKALLEPLILPQIKGYFETKPKPS